MSINIFNHSFNYSPKRKKSLRRKKGKQNTTSNKTNKKYYSAFGGDINIHRPCRSNFISETFCIKTFILKNQSIYDL